MEYVAGIDIGHSPGNKPTTGLVLLEQDTLRVRFAEPVTIRHVYETLTENLHESDCVSVAVIDGPLAPPSALRKQRLCERFFSSGIFSSTGNTSLKLRLQPAPTAVDKPFLKQALNVAEILMSQFNVPGFCFEAPIRPSVVEIFPTLFMAALLPPKAYEGERGAHTDKLWAMLWSAKGGRALKMLQPYKQVWKAAEDQTSVRARHEVRMAAVCAIAAHAISVGVPFGFIGTAAEQGFLLPGTRHHIGWMDADFHTLLVQAWDEWARRRADDQSALHWL